jgi:glycerophosphoryl diester phosphodiesterase
MVDKKKTQTMYRLSAPLVLGHRGASFDAPQNTIAAFTLAREMGADGVELDTSLSNDGVPIVIHDLSLDKTTNGTGPVGLLTVKELKELDAGSSHSAKYAGEQIPTLEEVFEAIGPDMIVNVELKSVSMVANGLEPAVLDVIRRHNALNRVIISSFNPFALRRFRKLAPDIPMGYLYSADEPMYLRNRWLMIGVSYEALHPHESMIDTAYMATAKRDGYRINTWTVDDPARILALRDLGVDSIISNRPDVALATLGRKD